MVSMTGLDALEILARVGKAIDGSTELARASAEACSELVDSSVVAVLLAPSGQRPALQIHAGRPPSQAELTELRDSIVEEFGRVAVVLDEDNLEMAISGEPMAEAGGAKPSASVIHQPVIVDGEIVGLLSVLLVLSVLGAIAPTAEQRRLVGVVGARIAETSARLPRSQDHTLHLLPSMIESMADGLIFAERSSDAALINPAARGMLGLDPEVAINQSFLKEKLGFYPFDLINVTGESSSPLREEVAIGDTVLHSVVSAVHDHDGELQGVAVVLRDLTEAKALAERQREFVSVVSHELRTPLTSITGALDIALSEYAGRLSSKQRRYLTLARESCTRLNAIVDDLLDVARSEEGRMPVRFTPLALDELARDVVERYLPAAQAKGIKIHVSWEDVNMRIAGDADRLTQVLNNLLTNALKFTPRGGDVEVEIFGPKVADGHVGVSVFNNGDPIPEKARERIFEKFEQVQQSNTRKVGGTGLGLAISRAIVEAHHGRIWVETRDEGTKFILTLPVAPSTDDSVDIDFQAQPEPVDGASVLIVEQDVHSSYILKGILMAAGYRVEVRQNPSDALALARQSSPALVVVAAGSDTSQQLAVIDILRHDPETSKCALVGVGDESDADRFAHRGVHDFLVKPVDAAKFLALASQQITDSSRTNASRVLVIDDDLSIRVICREVLVSGGYTVRTANGGVDALLEAKRFRPDIMLLDVMMPELDGFETAQSLRADPATAMTPIIFLSARGATEDKLRAFRLGAEDYIVKPFVAEEMLARVKKALERRELELGASPTTQLPGSSAIESEIERRIGAGSAAFCYLDLDNLKAFNDYYGYAKADGVIRQTGDLVRDVIRRMGTPKDFIGHIAGDDFVFITAADKADDVCLTICETFDQLVPLYYNRADRERGYIETKDRYGVMRRFPVMGVSIAAVTAGVSSYSQLASAAAEGKKKAKAVDGSAYIRDGEFVKR